MICQALLHKKINNFRAKQRIFLLRTVVFHLDTFYSFIVGASIARPLSMAPTAVTDGQHPRVASLALRAIHLLVAPARMFSVLPISLR